MSSNCTLYVLRPDNTVEVHKLNDPGYLDYFICTMQANSPVKLEFYLHNHKYHFWMTVTPLPGRIEKTFTVDTLEETVPKIVRMHQLIG